MKQLAATLLLATALLPNDVGAQSYFVNCISSTGKDATLLVDSEGIHTVGAGSLDEGDEIAVFTEDGRCVGADVWNGQNLAISVWGDDPLDSDKRGLLSNEPFMIRVWDESESRLYGTAHGNVTFETASSPPFRGEKTYVSNALYLVESINATDEALQGKNIVSTSVLKDFAAERGIDNIGILAVTRTEPYNEELNVYFTLSGSAVNGTDYQSVITTAAFSPGQRSVYVVVRPLDDGAVEEAETVMLYLNGDATYELDIESRIASMTIQDGGSALGNEGSSMTSEFTLAHAFPNPFSSRTALKFATDTPQRIQVDVYNVIGKRVAAIFDGKIQAHIEYEFLFDANGLPDGLYMVKATGKQTSVRSVILRR